MSHPALASFSPQVRDWFGRAFAEPTAAQAQAWPAIASGEHVLISAPTGSGKTLAAFLWALDRLTVVPAEEEKTRLVYVSPLKALSYDVEKNLRAPLRGRGAHLAITLERLAEQAGRDVQRMGLSATQNPLEEVGRFMVGPRRACRIVDPGVRKPLDLQIHVPGGSMVEPE